MQFHSKGDTDAAYGVREVWQDALSAPGASQMIFLKNLMLSKPYIERVPAQEIIAGPAGERYEYLAATRGRDYAFVYTFTGRNISISTDKLQWKGFKASWYSPVNGSEIPVGSFKTGSVESFDPPGNQANGNDWVLVLNKE
jgi:hypothetical protein